jgi:hypothetical protein
MVSGFVGLKFCQKGYSLRPTLVWESGLKRRGTNTSSIFGLLFGPELLINARTFTLRILINARTLAPRVANGLPKFVLSFF